MRERYRIEQLEMTIYSGNNTSTMADTMRGGNGNNTFGFDLSVDDACIVNLFAEFDTREKS